MEHISTMRCWGVTAVTGRIIRGQLPTSKICCTSALGCPEAIQRAGHHNWPRKLIRRNNGHWEDWCTDDVYRTPFVNMNSCEIRNCWPLLLPDWSRLSIHRSEIIIIYFGRNIRNMLPLRFARILACNWTAIKRCFAGVIINGLIYKRI